MLSGPGKSHKCKNIVNQLYFNNNKKNTWGNLSKVCSLVLFIYWLCWVFVVAWAFSSFGERGLLCSCGVRASHCSGFSLWSTVSRCTGFSTCGLWTSLLCGMWNLPGLGIEPVSPGLAGVFLSTVPPGKFCSLVNSIIPMLLKFGSMYQGYVRW